MKLPLSSQSLDLTSVSPTTPCVGVPQSENLLCTRGNWNERQWVWATQTKVQWGGFLCVSDLSFASESSDTTSCVYIKSDIMSFVVQNWLPQLEEQEVCRQTVRSGHTYRFLLWEPRPTRVSVGALGLAAVVAHSAARCLHSKQHC